MMSRGYGKSYRKGYPHASIQFDKLYKENSNRPSAARSAGTVGKWGITSFTSIRSSNGFGGGQYSEIASKKPRLTKNEESVKKDPFSFEQGLSDKNKTNIQTVKPKKFFKSRDVQPLEEVRDKKHFSDASSNKRHKSCNAKKFFHSKRSPSPTETIPKRDESKPPIVLRICRGKSRLLSDSDESESTPTPAASATSPRRVTRSTRRSMQQDSGSSPATAETPTDSFASLLSPEYIPPEKFELERKAVYDNLLGPSSPPRVAISVEVNSEELQTFDSTSGYASQEFSSIETIEKEPDLIETVESTNVECSAPEPKKSEASVESFSDSDSESSQPASTPLPVDLNVLEKHKDEIMDKILEKPVDAPAVKLVISKKKGSIFKSRSMVPEGTKKRRVLYKHKWCDDKEKGAGDGNADKKASAGDSSQYDEFGFEEAPLTRITRSASSEYDADGADSVTSVKCAKTDKDYYTVVRNVKKAHQIQEIGEFQEFNDDVEYILDALQDNNPTGTRCLSAITLATKCMAPAFRMHVRAHGIVAKFFKALHDATKDQSLGLCTATVMFVLSQDRLNMDLDRDCLELMLNLLESDVSYQKALDKSGLTSVQLHKNKMKVKELCADIQSQGHAMHLNLDNITVGQLAMETLLSLTSKRAGEWFKEELRELGGLQHIMETICECCRQVSDYVVVWTDELLDKLRKVDRCMRVLENVTQNNEQNQTYLLQYNDGIILDTLVKLYRLCDSEIPLYPSTDMSDKDSTGFVVREALLVTLKVLINLTHHFNKKSNGSSLIGKKPGIIEASLHLLLQIPHYIPEQKKFELGVLVLMLLINLIQDDDNKKLFINAKAPANFESIFPCDKSALEVLMKEFYHCQELARIAEKRTDAILDGEKDSEAKSQPKSHDEFIEETVTKLLQKAGIHMEYTFLASYIAMLVGFLVMENPEYEEKVRHFLQGNTFADMVEILKKFFSFMNLTASTEASICQIKDTDKVIRYMEECDKRQTKEAQNLAEAQS